MILWILGLVVFGWAGVSEAALCPAASVTTVCVDLTEASGVLNLKDTVITVVQDGVDLAPVTVPATAPTGGGTVNASMPTTACVSRTYKAKAYHQYTTSLGVMKSLTVDSAPGLGVVKDRTSETDCLKPPVNFTIH